MHKLIKPFMSNKATGHDDDTISNSEAIEMRCAMFPRSFFFSSAYQPRPLFDATGAGMETQTAFLMQQTQEWIPNHHKM